MMEVFDRSRRRVAILENAHGVSEQQRINSVWRLGFSLPWADPKNQFCRPFWYVRRDGGELYRIMPAQMDVDETGAITYQCEHVLATLIDNILFGYHVVGNLGTYTADVIRYVLNHQLVMNWVLAECDFRNQFEYGWEQESLLSALFSIAAALSGPYLWATDTSVYPWRLSLKRLDITGRPEMYVRRRHNMTAFRQGTDPQQVVTRLYPLGYGEGVNQLGIGSVNGGVPYLQSPKAVTDRYGIIERVWADRRYEDPASLKAAGEAMLRELQEPLESYEVGYQELGQSDYDGAAVGKRVRILFPEAGRQVDTIITEVNRNYEDVEQSSIVVANRETSIASSLADMADRQRIEQTYAQGATQLYSQALQGNASAQKGLVMDFFIPQEMRIINKVLAKIRLSAFRAYSQSTESQATQAASSTTTDAQTYSSAAGGGAWTTTGGGGGVTTDTGDSGINVKYANAETTTVSGHSHHIRHVISHQHEITLRDHTHRLEIGSHSHTVTIGGHSHTVTIPGHDHRITPGIFEFGSPKSFALYANGVKQADFSGGNAELDVTPFLVGEDRMIPRGSWLSLEVRPDDLAYISIDLIVQGFVQSRGDNTV